ncbi:rhamnogalacturonan acetylesterase [Colwellia sp. MEBiC06753]
MLTRFPLLALGALLFTIFVTTKVHAQQTLFMAGDSTMAIKDPKDYPETGWGVPFATFFSDKLNVVNLAKNGRSTKTFISEGLWKQVLDNAKQGDFVIIQFGHNDESAQKKDRYTTPEQYQANLSQMIKQAQQLGASVILMSPVTRRYFDEQGQIKQTHVYSPLARKVAKRTQVTFFDMDEISRAYFQAQGDNLSQLRFMHIKPDTHPNYPYGVRDNTHFNQLGAREVAQLVLNELKAINHPILQFIRTPDPKHLKLSY